MGIRFRPTKFVIFMVVGDVNFLGRLMMHIINETEKFRVRFSKSHLSA